MEFTSGKPSPEIFRKWCAIAAISGVLERKVWIHSFGGRLFPNLYVILVAPPGVGKSIVLNEVDKMWRQLPDHHTASASVTKASFVDELAEAERRVKLPDGDESYHALMVPSSELGVLLPSYDTEFMSVLTHLYDNEPYSESRRSRDIKMLLPNPTVTIFAATTPSYLNGILPEGAWDQGFLSRSFLIYSGERVLRNPFEALSRNSALGKRLVRDLREIGNLSGEWKFTDEARDAYVEWYMSGQKPVPTHPKLHNYLTRRGMHLLKLCIIFAISSSDEPVIEIDHYQDALDALIEMEEFIPDIFKAMRTGGDMKAIEDTYYEVAKKYAKSGEPVRESFVYQFLQERVPAHSVEHVLNMMIRAGLLVAKDVNKIGVCYIPGARATED